ncbi:tetratricopeptide repeat protein [Paractinoplanes rishiriensis]|uniref:tetratricopeptide repeat protein n=1 Tax=Paractinoplanes rishiriensis TaxID=1050105 RepID=UPI001943A937|nr:hypothetical protein [Actinoplanes rishiriensis]
MLSERGGSRPDQIFRAAFETPLPEAVTTLSELSGALNRLRGTRSYTELSRGARAHPDFRFRVLPRSTISDLLMGRSVPNRETLITFLAACGVSERDQDAWLGVWERVKTVHLRRPVGSIRVRDASPRRLGVRASIQVAPGADDLPTYVPRDLDAAVQAALHSAAAGGGFLVLVGGTSTGKTRTLVEAVRTVLPDWWLLDPVDSSVLEGLSRGPASRTVVWLDELRRYLDPPASAAATVRRLIDAGLVVVGTLWPEEYAGPSACREVLSMAQVISVPAAFTSGERRRAGALTRDPRIQVALETDGGIGVTQVLAAGPELVRHWEFAEQPYGKAIITAALEARRMGAQSPLTTEFLRLAAPVYLTSGQRATAPANWLELGLGYAVMPVSGAASCLAPVAGGMGQIAGYVTADYLFQRAAGVLGAGPLPDAVWLALVDHHQPGDTSRIAEHADRNGKKQHAVSLYRRLARTGHSHARWRLAALLAEDGQLDELRERAVAGDRYAARRHAALLVDRGRVDDAIEVLRAEVDAGNRPAARQLFAVLAEFGRFDELKVLANAGDQSASWYLSAEYQPSRGTEVAAQWEPMAPPDTDELRRLADDGDRTAARQLAFLLPRLGRTAELSQRADEGDQEAARYLAFLLAEYGRIGELRRRADNGDSHAARRLAKALAGSGDLDELKRRADNGDRHAKRVFNSLR